MIALVNTTHLLSFKFDSSPRIGNYRGYRWEFGGKSCLNKRTSNFWFWLCGENGSFNMIESIAFSNETPKDVAENRIDLFIQETLLKERYSSKPINPNYFGNLNDII